MVLIKSGLETKWNQNGTFQRIDKEFNKFVVNSSASWLELYKMLLFSK